MSPISSRRKRSVTAFVVLMLWLLAVISVVLWRRPEFWFASIQNSGRRHSTTEMTASNQSISTTKAVTLRLRRLLIGDIRCLFLVPDFFRNSGDHRGQERPY